jgi:hypothetical protein
MRPLGKMSVEEAMRLVKEQLDRCDDPWEQRRLRQILGQLLAEETRAAVGEARP